MEDINGNKRDIHRTQKPEKILNDSDSDIFQFDDLTG